MEQNRKGKSHHQYVQKKLLKFESVSLILFSVAGTIATEHSQISHVIALPGSRVAVSSTIQLITYNSHRLIVYDLQTGAESSSMTLEENPSGMAEVSLADRACIAVSYRYGRFSLVKCATIQACQHCQLCFSCATRKEQNKWKIQHRIQFSHWQ